MKVTSILIVVGVLATVLKSLKMGLEKFEIRGQGKTIQTKALQSSARNTEKSPRDLRGLAVTQTLVKYYQLALVGKKFLKIPQTLYIYIYIYI